MHKVVIIKFLVYQINYKLKRNSKPAVHQVLVCYFTVHEH